jgi:hypothetical protein
VEIKPLSPAKAAGISRLECLVGASDPDAPAAHSGAVVEISKGVFRQRCIPEFPDETKEGHRGRNEGQQSLYE